MKKIAVISSSVRRGRLSHRVALYLRDYLARRRLAEADILDLKEYAFPLFDERLAYMESPSAGVLDFARRFTEADGVVIVTPVYNSAYPAALKNAIDLLTREWRRKPVLIVSVTYGLVPGISTVEKLWQLVLRLGARPTPVLYTVIRAGEMFDESGRPADAAACDALAAPAVDEFMSMLN